MSKEHRGSREAKKPAQKTQKEKRADKRGKSHNDEPLLGIGKGKK